jgi:hypothetical protein
LSPEPIGFGFRILREMKFDWILWRAFVGSLKNTFMSPLQGF